MYVCVCNAITESMLKSNPSLKDKIGTCCGTCVKDTKCTVKK